MRLSKTSYSPQVITEARAVYRLLLSGNEAAATQHLSSLGVDVVPTAAALATTNCRWPDPVPTWVDYTFCMGSVCVPILVAVLVGHQRDWSFLSIDFISYCLVIAGVFCIEMVVYSEYLRLWKKVPFVKDRDLADRQKMVLAAGTLLSQSETTLSLIGALLEVRSAFVKGKDLDETVFDIALQTHLPICAVGTPLNDKQMELMLSCLQESTWHMTARLSSPDSDQPPGYRKKANANLALAIIDFYKTHPAENARAMLNELANLSPTVAKWRRVSEAARLVPGVTLADSFRNPGNSSKEPPPESAHDDGNANLNGSKYAVTRAFSVEQLEDEGLHFFLEVKNGAVLYLTGQDLYDITEFDPDEPNVVFPSTEIEISSERDITCSGEPLEFETFPSTFFEYWGQEYVGDMTLFEDVTFDELYTLGQQAREL